MRCVTGSDSDSDESDEFFEASSDTNTIQVDETILYSHLIYWKQDNWQTIQGTHFPMGWVEEMSCSIVPTLLCKTGRIWGALTHRSWTPSWELTPSHVCNTREPANQFWHAFLLTSLKNDNDGYFADMWAWHVCIQNQDQFHISQTASWNTFHHGLSLGVPISNLRSGFSIILTIRWCIGRSQSCSKQPNHPTVWKDMKKTFGNWCLQLLCLCCSWSERKLETSCGWTFFQCDLRSEANSSKKLWLGEVYKQALIFIFKHCQKLKI